MSDNEVSREDLFAELKSDLREGKSVVWKSYRIRLSKPMNKEEFVARRNSLEMTQAQLAQILDIQIKTVKEYEMGETSIPGLIAKVLRKMEDKGFREMFIDERVAFESSENIAINNK